MKHLSLSRQFIVFSVFSSALMTGLVIYGIHAQQQLAKNEPLVPTKQVDHTTSIGGQPELSDSPTQASSASAPTPPSTLTTSPTEVPTQSQVQKEETINRAPKQDEIAASVATEYPYSALVTAPNDPYYSTSWSMQKTGAMPAWNISTGTPVVVAVIDTGYALQHEDLASQWQINTNEQGMTQPGDTCWTGNPANKDSNLCDDDSNGYVDDWRGWNFVSKSNQPQAGQTSTNGIGAISHGTSVAGLIGAATNNGKGIASYNWSVRVLPLQALNDSGDGITSNIIAAIYYAVDNGAQVINLSLGGPASDPAMQTAVDYAYARNVVVVAAAGNCGTAGDAGCDGQPAPQMMYPALNNHVIAVGATDTNNARASFSSYGPGIDVVAPGSGTITSPLIDTRAAPYNYTNAYSASLYGTSFASPVVSSIVALIKSIRPSTSIDDITAIIDANATKVSAMNGQLYTNEYGHGLVSAASSMAIANELGQIGGTDPILLQTGDYRSEHSYSSNSTMSSGCKATASAYCTVRMVNTTNKFERFLPYTKGNTSGQAGWQWSGGILGTGEWSLQAMQGEKLSAPYLLFSK